MGDNQPKRHHYIPQGYLRQWSDDASRVAARRREKPVAFVANVKNVAVECDLHSVEREDGLDVSLEHKLGKLESDLPERFANLREGRIPPRASDERAHLAKLLSIQHVRTPEKLESKQLPLLIAEATGERPVSPAAMRRYLESSYLRRAPTPDELQGFQTLTNYMLRDERYTKQETLEMAFAEADEIVQPFLSDMAWSVEVSTGPAFITSDRPLNIWRRRDEVMDREGAGFLSAEEIWCALGPHHLLVLRPARPSQRYHVGAARIAQVNRHIAAACHEMVIGRSSDKLQLAELPMAEHRPLMQISFGDGFARDRSGTLIETGREILHLLTPYDDRKTWR